MIIRTMKEYEFVEKYWRLFDTRTGLEYRLIVDENVAGEKTIALWYGHNGSKVTGDEALSFWSQLKGLDYGDEHKSFIQEGLDYANLSN